MHKFLSILLVISIFFTSCISVLAEGLILPAHLKMIEAEAFYGDSSLEEVTVPVGTESIGNHAFANSGL